MTQISLPPEEEFRQLLLNKLPPVVARKDVARQLGGVVSMKTLANADSLGKGPLGAYLVGRSVVYPSDSLVRWIIDTLGVDRLNANITEL